VLDDEGSLVQKCGDEQQCAAGACLPACESAASRLTSVGCDFYAAAPESSGCFAAFIANTWHGPVTIKAEFKGASFDLSKMARIPTGSGRSIKYAPLVGGSLPAGEVAILFLDEGICPSGVDAPNTRVGGSGETASSVSDAVHIMTDRPVSAYTLNPYAGGNSAVASASMLLPTSVWDTNYTAVDIFAQFEDRGVLTQIVAMEDDTEVTLLPTGAILAGGSVAAAPAGSPQKYKLQRGQLLELASHDGLTGSPLQANKRIGVWAAAKSLAIPKDKLDVDTGHEQIPPVRAFGSQYAAVRYRNRVDGAPDETPPWRLLGVVDGTTLEYEPAPPAGAPTTLKAGELVMFEAAGPFIVRSQGATHPFYMSQHMTGCRSLDAFKPDGCPGGPETVNVIPTEQYLDGYIFFTDPTYPEANLVITRKRAPDGTFKAVQLDCAGELTGFQPVGKDYEYTRFDLTRFDFQKQGACDSGRHEIKSGGPFSLTVWGWGLGEWQRATSYAYPAGAGIREVTTVRVPPIVK
jgi:hypothetical protein